MPQISKAIIDENLRNTVFNTLHIDTIEGFHKINARQWGCILIDDNGERRYVRIGAIVAEMREDCTADELMAAEIADYEEKQTKKAAKAAERAEKAAKDKKSREEKKKKEEGD